MSKQKENKSEEENPDKKSFGYKKFCKAMKGHEKNVSVILNCHLLTEYFMDQIIQMSLKRGDLIMTEGRFSFSNKLLILKALDCIDDSVITAIKQLNVVRNNCSHEMDYKISNNDTDRVGRPFGKNYSKDKKKYKDRYILLGCTLVRIIGALESYHDHLIDQEEE